MGDGKHKQKYFRMRDTMMVMYKKKSNKGKYGRGSARYLKVCSALPAPLAQCWQIQLGTNIKSVGGGGSGTRFMP